MKKSRLTFCFIATAFLVATWSGAAQACKCDQDLSIKKRQYDLNNLIFVGKILPTEKPGVIDKILSNEKPGYLTVESLYEIKGEGRKTYEINFYLAEFCGPGMPRIGGTYLILARIGENQITAGGCGGTKELSPNELDLIKLLKFKEGETS